MTGLVGDARDVLPTLAQRSVHCCVTSPPYWGLRDYGVEGQIGLESTPQEYVEKLVGVFREVHRVLRDDGTLWLNLGDTYSTGAGSSRNPGGNFGKQSGITGEAGGIPSSGPNRQPQVGLKPKDLVGIPWRVALALQSDGWWLRSEIIWAKPNPMPESVTDRPTKAHEHVFLLSKSDEYFYDAKAIAEPIDHPGKKQGTPQRGYARSREDGNRTDLSREWRSPETRNARDVWNIPTESYDGAHFACFPRQLAQRCILAGCPLGGTVLDPFFGSGTTGQVAEALGRRWIGVELNPKYEPLWRERTAQSGLAFGE